MLKSQNLKTHPKQVTHPNITPTSSFIHHPPFQPLKIPTLEPPPIQTPCSPNIRWADSKLTAYATVAAPNLPQIQTPPVFVQTTSRIASTPDPAISISTYNVCQTYRSPQPLPRCNSSSKRSARDRAKDSETNIRPHSPLCHLGAYLCARHVLRAGSSFFVSALAHTGDLRGARWDTLGVLLVVSDVFELPLYFPLEQYSQ